MESPIAKVARPGCSLKVTGILCAKCLQSCCKSRLGLEHQACSCCGGELHAIGETVSEMLDHVPARLSVIRICRQRHGCRACGIIHQAPPERIAKGLASPALLAHAMVVKYCDHLDRARCSPDTASTSANSSDGVLLVKNVAHR